MTTHIEPTSVHKILFINLAYIGDVILSTPLVRALKKHYPSATIDMLITPSTAEVASGNPYVNQLIVYDKRGKHRNMGEWWKLVRQLRKQHYDLAITTNFSLRSPAMAWASGARWRVGFDAQHAGLFLTHMASAQRPVIKHEIENQMDVLAPLGIVDKDTSMEYKIDPTDIKNMHRKIKAQSAKPIVVICPFGRHALKSWTREGYSGVIKRIAPLAECYLIGGKAEIQQLEELNTAAGGVAHILAGTLTLGELAALLQQAKLLITVDTGPMHIGQAVGISTVALFGPTDDRVWGPRGEYDVIVKAKVECMPCYLTQDCVSNRCMQEIAVQDVIQSSLIILGK